MEIASESRLFDGRQLTIAHDSEATGAKMRVAVYLPPGEGPLPTLYWLSGLTCTEDNFTQKAGAQRAASELGMILVAPDTSPRGDGVADEDAYDLGQGAGFYVDATEPPWAAHFGMYSYIARELPALIAAEFPVAPMQSGISGHSMGGHGALVIGLREPRTFRSISAFSPVVAPTRVPWGEKAFSAYLGADRSAWAAYDACELVAERANEGTILIEQGEADGFLDEQLRPELFAEACAAAGQDLEIRRRPGYDHSYFFIASFIEDHLRFHHRSLTA